MACLDSGCYGSLMVAFKLIQNTSHKGAYVILFFFFFFSSEKIMLGILCKLLGLIFWLKNHKICIYILKIHFKTVFYFVVVLCYC